MKIILIRRFRVYHQRTKKKLMHQMQTGEVLFAIARLFHYDQ